MAGTLSPELVAELGYRDLDPAMAPAFCRWLAGGRKISPDALSNVALVAESLRSREMADLLAPLFPRVRNAGARAAFVRALWAARHPEARSIGRQVLVTATTVEIADAGALALAGGGASDCDLIATVLESHPEFTILGKRMAGCDRSRARHHFERWLSSGGTRSAIKYAAREGLGDLGDAPAAETLARVVELESNGKIRTCAVETASAIGGPRVRGAVLARLRDDPATSIWIWAAARLGLVEAIPHLVKTVTGNAPARARRDALCALGLLDAKGERAVMTRALASEDPQVCQAAAWALAQLERSGAPAREVVERLVVLATSSRDQEGIGAWALGRLRHSGSADHLRALLTELSTGPNTRSSGRLAMVAFALGEIGDRQSADTLKRLASDRTRSLVVREAATAAVERLGEGPRDRTEASPPGDGRGGTWHPVLPLVPFVRTGIFLHAGESATIYARGAWSYPGNPGGQLVHESPDHPPGLPELRLQGCVETQWHRVYGHRKRLQFHRSGELVLTPYRPMITIADAVPLGQMAGMARVLVEP
ncbi:MAG: HEAT repeat domain-containing protein [Candidatus Riflebacteria bacterium]|nr:HEAT repeat domain-containing protein [Candidatus Riflebacteria bacterium]